MRRPPGDDRGASARSGLAGDSTQVVGAVVGRRGRRGRARPDDLAVDLRPIWTLASTASSVTATASAGRPRQRSSSDRPRSPAVGGARRAPGPPVTGSAGPASRHQTVPWRSDQAIRVDRTRDATDASSVSTVARADVAAWRRNIAATSSAISRATTGSSVSRPPNGSSGRCPRAWSRAYAATKSPDRSRPVTAPRRVPTIRPLAVTSQRCPAWTTSRTASRAP